MNYYPLVSVRVLTYNSGKYVIETLESIKAQTYSNIELIVSDDCSTDDTVQKVQSWIDDNSTRFVDVTFLTSAKNTGVSANYNRSLQPCKGEWIKGIAGDDIMLPNCIEDNVRYVTEHPTALVVFSDMLIFFDKTENEISYSPASTSSDFFECSAEEQYQQLLRKENISLNPCSKFVNTEFVKSRKVDERVKCLEDMQFTWDCTSNGIKLHYFKKTTVKYRKHEGALTGPAKNKLISVAYIDSWISFYYLTRKPAFEKFGIDNSHYEKKVLRYLAIKHILKNKANLFTRVVDFLICRWFHLS